MPKSSILLAFGISSFLWLLHE